ncbi:MAG: glycosyltransferase [Rhodomicrobium sp.]
MAIRIAYFVHDLDDPAVGRRVTMLTLGGAHVTLAGFHRSALPVVSVNGVPATNFGRTEPAKLLSRVFSVAKTALHAKALAKAVRGADVIIARNLEMLMLAVRARNRFAPGVSVVYECLDIHRLLLSQGPAGRALRMLEDRLWQETGLLLTSSPAFVRNYFGPRGFSAAHRLIENKVLQRNAEAPLLSANRPAIGQPWRIGWFGVLRCRKSFDILSQLASGLPGKVEVVLRGRPAPSIFPDFEAEVARTPGVKFGGAYRNPDDLGAIYGGVHFAWAIDYFEASQNSAWLLPNRIYEASLFGAVPLALGEVETGRWLAARNAGVLLPDPPGDILRAFFEHLTADKYQTLAGAVADIPRGDLADDVQSCRAHIESLPLQRKAQAEGAVVLETPFSGSAR